MISVVLCKALQPSLSKRKSYDGKFVTANVPVLINDGATLTTNTLFQSKLYSPL